MASQITNLIIVYSTDYSGIDQRKHQSSASLAFVRSPVNSPNKWPITQKMFPFDDIIMCKRHFTPFSSAAMECLFEFFGEYQCILKKFNCIVLYTDLSCFQSEYDDKIKLLYNAMIIVKSVPVSLIKSQYDSFMDTQPSFIRQQGCIYTSLCWTLLQIFLVCFPCNKCMKAKCLNKKWKQSFYHVPWKPYGWNF